MFDVRPSKHSQPSAFARKLFLGLAGLLVLATVAQAGPPVDRSTVPADQRRLIVISIDGMRPDVLLRAKAPAIRDLMHEGSFTFYAESTDLAITLPTHTSMLTGLQPLQHCILFNDDPPVADMVVGKPTLFELAKAAKRSTAMVAAKSKFSVLNKPGTLDWYYYPSNQPGADGKVVKTWTDAEVGKQALEVLRKNHPDVLFVHFGGPDTIGHRDGWGSESQLAQVAVVDGLIGEIVAELDRQQLRGKTLILITADHGGAGNTHGGVDPRSRYIPFIAAGPGVRRNFDLTSNRKLVVHVEDTFATGLEWLGIERPKGIFGKPVMEIYQGSTSAAAVPAPATVPAAVPAP